MNARERFVELLKQIFEIDKADLDFGIYRILNIRGEKIEDFYTNELPKRIEEILTPFASANKDKVQAELTKVENDINATGLTLNTLPKDSPLVVRYNDLQKQLHSGTDIEALETDVYSALYSFFNRYYEEGDFISKRRYKEGVYAIPYEGEEVKLYWANQDQYYIKTSENFKDYVFKADDVTVHFKIVDATTEQNNNKEAENEKRVFMLYEENDEFPDIKTFEYDEENKELTIRFVYDIPTNKKKNYAEDNLKQISDYLVNNQMTLIPILLKNISLNPKKPQTLMEKHLKAYVAKNTFDYFIHKDLGGFLRRELDFYIKSEIMHLDDLDTENEARVNTYLAKVRAIKRVGGVIIDFLAQLEDFQKKLWLKKKFVVDTNWCITLDKIDEKFYPEIIANKEQVQEWVDMYAIDEIKGDAVSVAYSDPLTLEFLKQNQNLIVDTKHFSSEFKDRLVASIEDLDKVTDGIMFNGDNFHVIRLLQEKYQNRIKSVYIDPPYNSPSSEVLYKNSFKHSAWISLMQGRLIETSRLIKNDGAIAIAIDKYEHNNLYDLCRQLYPNNDLVSVSIEHNKKGTQGEHFSYSNEYAIFSIFDGLKKLPTIEREYKDWDWSGLRNWGSESERSDAANCFYPIYVKDSEVIGYGQVLDDEIHPDASNKILNEPVKLFQPGQNEVTVEGSEQSPIIAIYPIDDDGIERKWRYAFQSIDEIYEYLKVDINKNGVYQVKMPKHSDQFKTLWADSKYNAGDYGTKVLSAMGYSKKDFEYPKSIYTVFDCVYAISDKNSIVLDYFAGSATTAQAVMLLNRKDDENREHRKYILAEMGNYFSKITLPRVKKCIYQLDYKKWNKGKPKVDKSRVSQIVKYMRLESYEDALSNISLQENSSMSQLFGDEYMIKYMLDIESKESLLNLKAFTTPFDYEMKITEKNECVTRRVDVCETFNYLIGINVYSQSAIDYYNVKDAKNPAYKGAKDLEKDKNGKYGFRNIEGTLRDGRRALIIWRTIDEERLLESNAALDAYFTRYRINPQDREYDVIYVNGDNNVDNLRMDDEVWKVVRIEQEFNQRMWEE